jgi:hypothetical protein
MTDIPYFTMVLEFSMIYVCDEFVLAMQSVTSTCDSECFSKVVNGAELHLMV